MAGSPSAAGLFRRANIPLFNGAVIENARKNGRPLHDYRVDRLVHGDRRPFLKSVLVNLRGAPFPVRSNFRSS